MRVLRCLALLLVWIAAGPALAGPWPRAEDGTFLSLSSEVDRDDNSYTSLYGEYGVTPRSTFGFELGHASAGENSALLWLQRSLDHGSGRDRWTVSAGAGMIERDGAYMPLGQIGSSWGRGFDSLPMLRRIPGGGWVAVDARVKVAGKMKDEEEIRQLVAEGASALNYLTAETTGKADVTLGWHATGAMMLINQLRLEDRKDTGFSGKLATSIVRDLAGPARLELGAIAPLSGDGEAAVKLGTWLEF